MKNKIPCEMIKDLLPSYIDELTSEITEKEVKEHLSECESCRKVFSEMKNPDAEPIGEESYKAIDFLKYTRRKMQKVVSFCLVTVLIVCISVPSFVAAKKYLSGVSVSENAIECDVSVEGKELKISAYAKKEEYAVKDLDFICDDGKVTVSYKAVRKSALYNGKREEKFTAENEITYVVFGERIVWAEGTEISPVVADVYGTRHPYIGDMSKNSKTSEALNVNRFGRYINKLQTASEPYDWKIIYLNSYSSERQAEMEKTLKYMGYAMLASVDNLGTASFEYVIDGEKKLLTVTEKEATDFMGEDIKTVGSSINKFEKLMKKTGLSEEEYIIAENGVSKKYLNNFTVQLTNKVAGVGEISLLCYADGKLLSKQTAMLEDSSASINNYPVLFYKLIPADLKCDKWDGEKEIEFRLSLTDYKGKKHLVDAEGFYTLGAELGKTYCLTLDGSSRLGYMLTEA